MTATLRPTEERNPRTLDIDLWPSSEIIRAMFAEDARAVDAASSVVAELADLVDRAVESVARGGRIHYFGAGASGRLALLDATEATPTFGTELGFFNAHFPGGAGAVMDSRIDLEDSRDTGYDDARLLTETDVVIGITASGSTAYVQGAFEQAKENGSLIGLVTSNRRSQLAAYADVLIAPDTGAEALTGSTRLKAGTATKVILNAFSTSLMIRLGRTYSNLMVDLVATNEKLEQRAINLLCTAVGSSPTEASTTLTASNGETPVALLVLLSGKSADECRAALRAAGSVRAALPVLV